MNSFLLLCDVFSFVPWKKLKTPKRHFEINWPLAADQPHSRVPFSSSKEDKYVWYIQLSTDLMLVWKCSYYALFSRNLTQWVPSSLPTTPSLTDRRVCWKMLCFSSKFQYLKTYKNRHCALLLLNWLLLGHCIYFDTAKVISRSVLADCCHLFTRLIKIHNNLKDTWE